MQFGGIKNVHNVMLLSPSVAELSHDPKQKPWPLGNSCPPCHPLGSSNLDSTPVSMKFPFEVPHILGITQYLSFCVWLTSLSVFRGHLCCGLCQNVLPFYGWITTHCISKAFSLSIIRCWTHGLFPLSGCCESCCCEHECPSVWIPVFESFL